MEWLRFGIGGQCYEDLNDLEDEMCHKIGNGATILDGIRRECICSISSNSQ
jgi:hypothetical protein